jgi:hypothetical protein
MTFFTTTKSGKLDITVTLFNKTNTMILQRSSTYDTKPTLKEIKEKFKIYKREGASLMRVTTTPSGNCKYIKL